MTESDTVERPGLDGRPRQWPFSRQNRTVVVDPRPRISVNEVLTTYRLVLGGAGLGIIFDHLCVPNIEAGQIVRLLPDWTISPVEINVVFPSKKIISPTVRVFVDFLKEIGV